MPSLRRLQNVSVRNTVARAWSASDSPSGRADGIWNDHAAFGHKIRRALLLTSRHGSPLVLRGTVIASADDLRLLIGTCARAARCCCHLRRDLVRLEQELDKLLHDLKKIV